MTSDEMIAANIFEDDICRLAGKYHDLLELDDQMAHEALFAIVARCVEQSERQEKRAEDRADRHAREEHETAIPPYGFSG